MGGVRLFINSVFKDEIEEELGGRGDKLGWKYEDLYSKYNIYS